MKYIENLMQWSDKMSKEKIIKVVFTESDIMLYNNFIDMLINSFLEEI